jgi:hypothetical protein
VLDFYLIPEVLVEVLEGAGESDVGDVDNTLQADAVPTDRLGHRLQVGADAALNLTKINTVITIKKNYHNLTNKQNYYVEPEIVNEFDSIPNIFLFYLLKCVTNFSTTHSTRLILDSNR